MAPLSQLSNGFSATVAPPPCGLHPECSRKDRKAMKLSGARPDAQKLVKWPVRGAEAVLSVLRVGARDGQDRSHSSRLAFAAMFLSALAAGPAAADSARVKREWP
jgi:hypothetical protein